MNAQMLDEIRSGAAKAKLAAANANATMCEGPLSKQGSGLFGGWNERWFRLTGNGLSYYQNPKAAPKFGEHATTIDISQGKYFRTHKAIENSIEIVIGGSDERTYILKAQNLEDRNKWLRNLSDWQKGQRSANNNDPTTVIGSMLRSNDQKYSMFNPSGGPASTPKGTKLTPDAFPDVLVLPMAAPKQQDTLIAFLHNRHERGVAVVLQLLPLKSAKEMDAALAAVLGVAALTRSTSAFLAACIEREVATADSEHVLARANTVANRTLTAFVRAHAHEWLRAALRTAANAVATAPADVSFEIDPERMPRSESVKANRATLIEYAGQFVEQILISARAAPPVVRAVVAHLCRTSEARFPGAGHKAVFSLLFHRYLCPALVLPDQYRFMDSGAPPAAAAGKRTSFELRRRLALVSKVLQNLAAGVPFAPEDFMAATNEFLERNFARLRALVDEFVTPDDGAAEFAVAVGAGAGSVSKSELMAAGDDIAAVDALFGELARVAPLDSSASSASASAVGSAPSSASASSSFAAGSAPPAKRASILAAANSELHKRRVHSDVLSFVDDEFRSTITALLSNDHRRAVEIAQQLSAGKEAKEIEKISSALLSVMEVTNCTVSFLGAVMLKEVESTEADQEGSLFRSASIASRLIANFMRLHANSWLRAAVRESFTEISTSDLPFEIDPAKIDAASENLETNLANLSSFCDKILAQIFASAANARPVVREVARQLFLVVGSKFAGARHSSVGGLLFLRYLMPALLAPDQFGMYEAGSALAALPRKSSATRRFVLIAKVVQNLSNGVEFGGKEEFMRPLNALLLRHRDGMRAFVDAFVTPPYGAESFVSEFREVTKAEVDCVEEDLRLLKAQLGL